MIAGYLFVIGIWLLIILTASHWFDFLWKQERQKQNRFWLLISLVSLLISQNFYLPIHEKVLVNASYGLLMFYAVMLIFYQATREYFVQIVTVVLFLAVFYAAVHELFLLDPVLMIMPIHYALAVIFSLFICLSFSSIRWQLTVCLAAFLLGEGIHQSFLIKHLSLVILGDADFRDQILLGVILISLAQGVQKMLSKVYSKIRKKVGTLHNQEG